MIKKQHRSGDSELAMMATGDGTPFLPAEGRSANERSTYRWLLACTYAVPCVPRGGDLGEGTRRETER